MSRMAAVAARAQRGRFTVLAILMLTVLLCAGSIRDIGLRELIVHSTFSVLLLLTMWGVGPRLRIVTAALGLSALISLWTLHLFASHISRVVGFALTGAFLALLTVIVLLAVLRGQRVTADTIVGALCVYLLFGLTWGNAYALIDLVTPNAFLVAPDLAQAADWGSPTSPIMPLLQYFSFVTLSTLGYGDITPLAPFARSLAVFEAMAGQLYVAVLIARLVGIHTAAGQRQ